MGNTAINALLTAEYGKEKAKDQRYDQVWNDFMSSYSNLGSDIDNYHTLLKDAFGNYKTGLDNTTNTYTGTLSGLADKLNAPESKVSFGLAGFDPVTMTTRQAREDVGTLGDIAKNIYSANRLPASEQYNYDKTAASGTMDKYNALKDLATQVRGGDTGSVVNAYAGTRSQDMGPMGALGAIGNILGATGQGAGGVMRGLGALGFKLPGMGAATTAGAGATGAGAGAGAAGTAGAGAAGAAGAGAGAAGLAAAWPVAAALAAAGLLYKIKRNND